MAKILVVDDELGIRELLSEILGDEGHTVELAENAAQARAARLREQPDMVLLDIWMPDTDGVSLLKEWANNSLLTMPVIMMSGHGTIDTAVEATRLGAKNFLEKPISLQKLFSAVRQALDAEPMGMMSRPPMMASQPPMQAAMAAPAQGMHHNPQNSTTRSIAAQHIAAQRVTPQVNAPVMAQATLGASEQHVHSQQGMGMGYGVPQAVRQQGPITTVPLQSASKMGQHMGGHVTMSQGVSQQMGMHGGGYQMSASQAMPMPSTNPHAVDVVLSVPTTQMRYMPAASLSHPPEVTVSSAQSEPRGEQSFCLDGYLRDVRDQFERAYFEYHLTRERGSMTRVAEKSGLERTHLYRKLKQLGVDISGSRRSR